MRWFPNRKYKSGTRWGVWLWTDTDSEYIVRLHILKAPFGALCLHWIKKPDPEPYMHDHPVTFLSVILRGCYAELRHRPGETDLVPRFERHDRFNFIRAHSDDYHSIVSVERNTLTLCFMGPKTREWGFHHPKRWIPWKEYYAAQRKGVQL